MQNVHFSIKRLDLRCPLYEDVFPHLFFTHLKDCVVHPEKLTRLLLLPGTTTKEDTKHESIVLTSLMLHPLLSFKELRQLDLGHLCTAHMDDSFLNELALSCPGLEQLYLGDQKAWLIAPLLTFNGVISLLEHCRQLSDLGVFFNATHAVHATPAYAVSPKIKTFLVGVSPIYDPVRVAAVLSFLFPSATHIGYCIPDVSPKQLQGRLKRWVSVEMIFGTFVSVRRQSWEQGWAEGKAAVEKPTMA